MIHIRPYSLFESVKPPADIVYYHGSSKQEHGESILASGELRPGNMDIKRGNKLTPIMGMTYATPDLRTGVIYALGGIMMSHDPWQRSIDKDGQYGYLFEIDNASFSDVVPDEDYVGKLINIIEERPTYYEGEFESKALDWPNASNFLSFAKYNLTALQYKKAKDYNDYGDFAVAGKKLNRVMSDNMKQSIISMGCPVGNRGLLKISKAWRIDKTLSKSIKDDCSNFFELAEKVDLK